MSTKDIEARLERSLRSQVRAPKLGRDFNAAVWARIAREEAPAALRAEAPSRVLRASRWLALSNGLGIAAALGVALYFAIGALAGVDVPSLDLGVTAQLPQVSDETIAGTTKALGQLLGLAAVAFGLSFTSFGRRVLRSFN